MKKPVKSNIKAKTSKVNFKSTKTRIIFTLLVFGILGGGFALHRSYAATVVGTYSVGTGTVNVSGNYSSACKISYPEEPQKNRQRVVSIYSPSGVSCNVNVNIKRPYLSSIYRGKAYKLCVFVKGVGSGLISGSAGRNAQTSSFSVNNTQGYEKKCTGTFYQTDGATYATGWISNIPPPYPPGVKSPAAILNVATFTLERQN